MPGLSDAQEGSRCQKETVFVAGYIVTKETDNRVQLFSAFYGSLYQILRAGSVDMDTIGHIAGDNSRQSSGIQEHMAGREGKMFSAESLNFSFGDRNIIFKFFRKYGPVIIYTAHLKHDGRRLHDPVFLPPGDKGNPGSGRHVSVSGGIDDHFGKDGLPSGFILNDHTFHDPVFYNRGTDKGVEKQGNIGLHKHVQKYCFQFLRMDGLTIRRTPLSFSFDITGSLQDLFIEPSPGPSGPVAHHAGSSHTSHVPGLLDQHHASVLPGRGHGCSDSGRSSAQNQHIHISNDRNLTSLFPKYQLFHKYLLFVINSYPQSKQNMKEIAEYCNLTTTYAYDIIFL